MAPASLVDVASEFHAASEELHDRFLAIGADEDCENCSAAALGEAMLAARMQAAWGEFSRAMLVSSASGAHRRDGTWVPPLPSVKGATDAERLVKDAGRAFADERGLCSPVWHAPWFALQVGSNLGLGNLPALQAALGPTLVPGHITTVRNVLVHPGQSTLQKYEQLQAKLGMLNVDPEHLIRQPKSPGVALFTSWVRELQSVADASAQ